MEQFQLIIPTYQSPLDSINRSGPLAFEIRLPFRTTGDGKNICQRCGRGHVEEINDLTPGQNYGWPLAEGMSSNPTFKNPVFTYTHGAQTDDTVGCAIPGGTFYNPAVPQFLRSI